ncbi:MAG: aspartate carbamoyltransferase catalytic subunit [Chlamydiae bacterium]|nr:aspartate carbamoyltransferase catalytic subunit [Chlamydiota bacterium]MBI3266114.1 aspartate carbamoyltransferase catalytic subunit [Chlamydiota bacterium]
MDWHRKHLLGLEDLSPEEIVSILDTAESFKDISIRPIKKAPALRGKTVATLFYEPSTRTRTSFELAAKRLSADTLNVTIAASSVVKGESLKDTVRNLEALKIDCMIVRHECSGVPHLISRYLEASVVNAGDGSHEHPTQALVDLFTIRQKRGSLTGLKATIVGDILHSRVARSNIFGMLRMGMKVHLVGPQTLIPRGVERLGVTVSNSLDDAIPQSDVLMFLRIQSERQKKNLFPSLREYSELFGMTRGRLQKAKSDVLIMHPGPINRGVELASEVADSPRSVILDQVTNGLAVRMAVLFLVAGGGREG